MIDLSPLLEYFDKLKVIMDNIYPEKLTTENIENYNFNLDVRHPNWVRVHFPLMLIHHKPKAGKLRNSKSIDVMYQNNNNIITQMVLNANDFGQYYRKNKHKGYKNIVAAITLDETDMVAEYSDRQKIKKYKNFDDLSRRYAPDNSRFEAMCMVLEEIYPCNSTGPLTLF